MIRCFRYLLVCLALVSSTAAVDTLAGEAEAGAGSRWGHEPYAAASPLDVAVSPVDGRIYVADTTGGKVVELTADFKPTGREIAMPGVVGVDVAADGRLAIVAGGPGAGLFIVPQNETTPARVFEAVDKPPLTDALGVLWGPNDTLLVFDAGAGAGRVKVFDAHGRPLLEFGDFTWTRKYHSTKQDKDVTEEASEHLRTPCRGDWLPDGRLLVVDYEGPVIDPELNRRAGMTSIWKVDLSARTATFEKMLPQDDYYPTSKAGDVAVERATGRIYTAEADFPLTDHDFVRVYDDTNEPPRYGTNFFPYRFLTHPRGLAVARNGDVVVADADKGLVFAIPKKLFDTARGEHDPLEWPKVLRIPVCERERVVLEYTTLEPALSRVEFAPLEGDWYQYPSPPGEQGKRTVDVPAFDANGRELKPATPGTFHRVELTGLASGRRYAFRYLVAEKCYPGPLWSETELVTTQPPEHKTQYLDAEVLVLLFTNCWTSPKDPNVRPQPAAPGPLRVEEIEGVKQRLEWARRFYWINSRCKFNVHFTYVLDDTPYENGPTHNYGYWPDDDHQTIDAILAKHGVKHAGYAGLCTLYGFRHWEAGERKWVLSGSGGNTWGSVHDGSAMNTFSCGGDTAWLFVHEYGHSMSINYVYSGQTFHFNHFHWNYLPTRYAAHYDGMSALCREFSDVAYWSNKYGRLRVVEDQDGDGIPDDDPNCCLDEKRFGSDPVLPDTAGCGLTDLEKLMSTEGLAHYDQAFNMRQIEPVFEPDPEKKDCDGDGIPDGEDPYPLYPWDTTVRFAQVTVDGKIGADEWPQGGFRRRMNDPDIHGDVRLAWDFRNLYVGLVQKVEHEDAVPARIYMELDANADGFTVGADNLELTFEPQADGKVHIRTKHNDTVFRMKPIWRDNILPNPRDIQARWARQGDEFHLEIAIPQTKDAGLDLVRFEPLAFMVQLKPQHAKQELRLFEPQQHFEVRLR